MICLEDKASRKYTPGSRLDDSSLGTLEEVHEVEGRAGWIGGRAGRLRF